MPDNETDNTSVHKKDTTGIKRKASDGSNTQMPKHIEGNIVMENGAIIGVSPPQGEGSSPVLF